jgi:hypothetical protein
LHTNANQPMTRAYPPPLPPASVAPKRALTARAGIGIAMFVALLLASINSVGAITFSSNLESDTTRVGEGVVLSLTFVGGPPTSQPEIPAVPNLKINYAGTQQSAVIENGRATRTTTLLYLVTPTQPGNYIIPAFKVQAGGANLPSQPLKLKVLGSNEKPPNGSIEKLAFIKLITGKTEVYVGEVFPVEIRLYFQAGRDIQMPNLRCDGFTVGKMIPMQTQEQIGNQVYSVVIFKTLAVPVKAGRLNFGPAECNLNVQVRQNNPNDLFGARVTLQQVSPTSDPLLLNVLPLPAKNVPPSFSGAVGNYSLTFSASPTNLIAGDPITVKIQIAGRGALDNVLLPGTNVWHDFKTYPPTSKTEMPDPLNPVGTKTFEQIVMPQNAEIKELPAFQFSYFDPELKAYRTLSQPALPLLVRPHDAVPQQPTIVVNAIAGKDAPAAREIVHIKTYAGALSKIQPPLLQQRWFLAVQTVPILAWIAAIVLRRRADSWANNPRLRRQHQVSQLIQATVPQLHQLAQERQVDSFFASMFRLLQEQLGERLDLPASAITEAVIDERLRPLGVPEPTLTLLHELFQSCNQARYAQTPSSQELAALLPPLEMALGDLAKMKGGA